MSTPIGGARRLVALKRAFDSEALAGAMATVTLLLARCDAARTSLQDAGESDTASVSDQQSGIFMSLMEQCREDGQAVAQIKTNVNSMAKKLVDIGLTDADLNKLLTAVGELIATRKAKGWKLQDYTSMFQYFTEAQWAGITPSRGTQLGQKQIEIKWFEKACSLNCEHPSELTTKLWLGVELALLYSLDQIAMMMPYLKEQHSRIKTDYKAFIKNVSFPNAKPESLPLGPNDFRVSHPQIFNRAFPEAGPVICKMELDTAFKVTTFWTCRGKPQCPSQLLFPSTRAAKRQTLPYWPDTMPQLAVHDADTSGGSALALTWRRLSHLSGSSSGGVPAVEAPTGAKTEPAGVSAVEAPTGAKTEPSELAIRVFGSEGKGETDLELEKASAGDLLAAMHKRDSKKGGG